MEKKPAWLFPALQTVSNQYLLNQPVLIPRASNIGALSCPLASDTDAQGTLCLNKMHQALNQLQCKLICIIISSSEKVLQLLIHSSINPIAVL